MNSRKLYRLHLLIFSVTALVCAACDVPPIDAKPAAEHEICANGGYWNSMPTGLDNSLLRGLWGAAADDVYAIGGNGLIVHFDGVEWSVAHTDPDCPLRDIDGRSATDIFAAGGEAPIGTCVLHFDGATWTKEMIGMEGGVDALFVTDTGVYAAGGSPHGAELWWYDNVSWRRIAADFGRIEDIYAVSADSAYFLTDMVENCDQDSGVCDEYGLIVHYDGSAFSIKAKVLNTHFDTIHGQGDVFVFGHDYELGTVVYRSNGDAFQALPFGLDAEVKAVWMDANDSVFGACESGTVVHFNGQSWQEMLTGTSQSLRAIWGIDSQNVFAVGARGTALHYSCEPEHWEEDSDEETCDWEVVMNQDVNELDALWLSPAGDPYLAGSEGIWRLQGNQLENLWSDNRILDLWGTPDDELYAVGSDSTVVRCANGSCAKIETGVTADLQGVFGFPGGPVYAVGGSQASGSWTAVILEFDGAVWREHDTGSTATLQNIWGASADRLYAAGVDYSSDRGVVLSYDGTVWREAAERERMTFDGIWGSSPADVYATGHQDGGDGAAGVVLHFDGAGWSEVPIGQGLNFYAVWGTSAQDVYVSAATQPDIEGVRHFSVYRFDGTSWRESSVCSEGPVVSLHGDLTHGIYGVENEGILYRYEPMP